MPFCKFISIFPLLIATRYSLIHEKITFSFSGDFRKSQKIAQPKSPPNPLSIRAPSFFPFPSIFLPYIFNSTDNSFIHLFPPQIIIIIVHSIVINLPPLTVPSGYCCATVYSLPPIILSQMSTISPNIFNSFNVQSIVKSPKATILTSNSIHYILFYGHAAASSLPSKIIAHLAKGSNNNKLIIKKCEWNARPN